MNDEIIHSKAQAYAKENCVDYSTAIERIAKQIKTQNVAAQFSAISSCDTDAYLDFQARNYVEKHGVSYSEAISAVCSFSTSNFANHDPASISFSEIDLAPVGQSPASAIERQWIEIFRAGTHTADDGRSLHFSVADIREIANSYAPNLREAPLVLGHPATDSPAQGWVKRLDATQDGRLLMSAGKISANFAQMVKDGRFKKRSASLYSPMHPNNPTPGRWYLRHVGWLGAQQPAVAGLKDVTI